MSDSQRRPVTPETDVAEHIGQLRRERDEARALARLLAHLCPDAPRHVMALVREALAFPKMAGGDGGKQWNPLKAV